MKIIFYILLGGILTSSILFLIFYGKRIKWWFYKSQPKKNILPIKKSTYAVLIPARNEGQTILPLLHSLQAQRYDRNKFFVYVVVKEKEDPTIQLIQAAYPSANIYVDEEQRTKGHALDFGIKRILESKNHQYDGFLILDADTLIAPDFMSKMNEAFQSGKDVYNSKLIVKNYLSSSKKTCSWASHCNGLIWTLMSELGNQAKSDLGLVTMTLGTGLLIKGKHIEEWQGWPFQKTLTEDMELQRYCVLHHLKTEYVKDAICYVEEATGLKMTNIRRTRWMTGVVSCDRLYDKEVRNQIKTKEDKKNFYAIHSLYYVYAYVGSLCLFSLLSFIFACVSLWREKEYASPFFLLVLLCFSLLYSGLLVMTLRIMYVDRKHLPMKTKTKIWIALTHPFYYMGYIKIMFSIFIFTNTTKWKRIERIEFKETSIHES